MQVARLVAVAASFALVQVAVACGQDVSAQGGAPARAPLPNLERGDFPGGWHAGSTRGAPAAVSAATLACIDPGRPAPRATAAASSPVFTYSGSGGELLAQSGVSDFATGASASEILVRLGSARAPGCLGRLVDEEVGPALPPGVRVASTQLEPFRAEVPSRARSVGYSIALDVIGSGVSTVIHGTLLDESRSYMVGGITFLAIGTTFPAPAVQGLVAALDARMAPRARRA